MNPGESTGVAILPDGPGRRWYYQAAALNGKLYYHSGGDGSATASYEDLWEYDIVSRVWKQLTVSATRPKRAQGMMAATPGKLYVYGGTTTNANTRVGNIDIYDIGSNSWTAGVAGRVRVNSCLIPGSDGNLYTLGGLAAAGAYNRDLSRYNVLFNTWTVINATAAPHTEYGLYNYAAVIYGNEFVTFGGTQSGSTSTCFAFDLTTGARRSLANMPAATRDASAVLIGSKAYVSGNQSIDSQIYVYDFITDTWETKKSIIGTAFNTMLGSGGKLYQYSGRMSGVNPENLPTNFFIELTPGKLQNY